MSQLSIIPDSWWWWGKESINQMSSNYRFIAGWPSWKMVYYGQITDGLKTQNMKPNQGLLMVKVGQVDDTVSLWSEMDDGSKSRFHKSLPRVDRCNALLTWPSSPWKKQSNFTRDRHKSHIQRCLPHHKHTFYFVPRLQWWSHLVSSAMMDPNTKRLMTWVI